MTSTIQNRILDNGTHVTVTAQRIDNDVNGNPRYSLQLWANNHLWYPKMKGYRYSKKNTYTITTYNLEDGIEDFILDLNLELKKYQD